MEQFNKIEIKREIESEESLEAFEARLLQVSNENKTDFQVLDDMEKVSFSEEAEKKLGNVDDVIFIFRSSVSFENADDEDNLKRLLLIRKYLFNDCKYCNDLLKLEHLDAFKNEIDIKLT